MPLYEYKCVKCRRHTDKIEKVSGPHLKKCPHCGGKVESVVTAPAIKFKGSGWYVTDYASKSGGDGAKTEKTAGEIKETAAKEASGKESAARDSSSKGTSEKKTAKKE